MSDNDNRAYLALMDDLKAVLDKHNVEPGTAIRMFRVNRLLPNPQRDSDGERREHVEDRIYVRISKWHKDVIDSRNTGEIAYRFLGGEMAEDLERQFTHIIDMKA